MTDCATCAHADQDLVPCKQRTGQGHARRTFARVDLVIHRNDRHARCGPILVKIHHIGGGIATDVAGQIGSACLVGGQRGDSQRRIDLRGPAAIFISGGRCDDGGAVGGVNGHQAVGLGDARQSRPRITGHAIAWAATGVRFRRQALDDGGYGCNRVHGEHMRQRCAQVACSIFHLENQVVQALGQQEAGVGQAPSAIVTRLGHPDRLAIEHHSDAAARLGSACQSQMFDAQHARLRDAIEGKVAHDEGRRDIDGDAVGLGRHGALVACQVHRTRIQVVRACRQIQGGQVKRPDATRIGHHAAQLNGLGGAGSRASVHHHHGVGGRLAPDFKLIGFGELVVGTEARIRRKRCDGGYAWGDVVHQQGERRREVTFIARRVCCCRSEKIFTIGEVQDGIVAGVVECPAAIAVAVGCANRSLCPFEVDLDFGEGLCAASQRDCAGLGDTVRCRQARISIDRQYAW